MDALPFLAAANPKRQPIYVLFGDEDFLKLKIIAAFLPPLPRDRS